MTQEALPAATDARDVLCRRACRYARSGEFRKAALALKELASQHQEAALWVRLGSMLVRAHREDEAVDALKRGLWLHRQAGADGRARTVARLIHGMVPSDAKIARLAA